jgi:hypothetical protein
VGIRKTIYANNPTNSVKRQIRNVTDVNGAFFFRTGAGETDVPVDQIFSKKWESQSINVDVHSHGLILNVITKIS